MSAPLPYDNRTGRPPGRMVRALGLVVPGVARVRADAGPYADAWHARNLEALGRPGRRWVVLGDSMAQSVGASSVGSGWVDVVARRLGDLLPPVLLNLSATGARVADVLDQQLPVLADLPSGDGPDLLTVMVGSNDVFGGPSARAALPDRFARLVEALPDGAVVCSLPQPRTAARLANRHLDDAVAAGRLRIVDMRTDGPDSWAGKVAADYFHPNDAGHAAIAAAVEPVVRRALRGR